MRRPFKDKRPVGPFITSTPDISSPDAYESDSDAEEVAERIVRRTPATVNRAEYQGYFSEPSIFIDLNLPSSSPYTFDREYHSSSLSATAEDGRMSEFTLRFPAIDSRYISKSDLEAFVSSIAPDFYRVRIAEFGVDEDTMYYHAHLHYSSKRRNEIGPPLNDQAPEVNRTIRQWYENIEDQLDI